MEEVVVVVLVVSESQQFFAFTLRMCMYHRPGCSVVLVGDFFYISEFRRFSS